MPQSELIAAIKSDWQKTKTRPLVGMPADDRSWFDMDAVLCRILRSYSEVAASEDRKS